MDFSPLMTADLAIQIHATAAMLAFFLGTAVLLRRKGDRLHKAMGRIWIATMVVVALSSFLITEIRLWGPYSFIHLLSIFTLFGVVMGVRAIRRGDVKGHRNTMIVLYGGALILAGAFTLLPGRRMHQLLFADGGGTALLLGLALLAAIAGALAWRRVRAGSAIGSKPS